MPNFSRNRSKSPSATLFDDSVYVCSNSVLAISAGSIGGASGDASHSTRSPFSWWCSFFYPFICLINKISYVIKVISHLIYLRPIILCPVGFYGLFTLVFECSIPDILDDFSEFLATLFGGHEMRLTDKYINIAIHTYYRMDRLPTTSMVSTGKNESGLCTFVKALSLVWPELAEAGRGVMRLSVE